MEFECLVTYNLMMVVKSCLSFTQWKKKIESLYSMEWENQLVSSRLAIDNRDMSNEN